MTEQLRKAYITRNLTNVSGIQHLYRFDNDYGASVVCSPLTHGGNDGLFELGVIKFTDESYKLVYDTPITSDVIGYLTPLDVNKYLTKIENL